MIDLDNFKTVNDTLGHPAGDRVIQEFAVFSTRPLSVGEAEAKARELIEAWGGRSDACDVELGCSVGMVRAVRGRSFFDIYREADRALYASKGNGKGCFSW